MRVFHFSSEHSVIKLLNGICFLMYLLSILLPIFWAFWKFLWSNIITSLEGFYHLTIMSPLALRNQEFPVRVRLLPICRDELSVVITRLMSKCLWSGWKWLWGVKEMHFPFPCSPVIREWSWKKTQKEKTKNNNNKKPWCAIWFNQHSYWCELLV